MIMKWTKQLALGAMLIGSAAFADTDMPVDGDFKNVKADKTPASWMLNKWAGFQPDATLTVVTDGDDNILKVTDVAGKRGTGFRTGKPMNAAAGDTVKISMEVRGTGKATACLYFFTAKNGWNQTSSLKQFALTDTWKEYEISIPVTDGKNGPTAKFDVVFGCTKGSTLDIKDIDVELEKAGEEDDD